MIIQNSTIELSSSRYYQEERIQEEKYRFWIGNRPPEQNINNVTAELEPVQDTVSISPEAQAACEAEQSDLELSLRPEDKMKIELIQTLLERITGKKFRFLMPKDLKLPQADPHLKLSLKAMKQNQVQRAGWGLEYDYHESYREMEQSSVKASGTVKTADGREININVQLNMSREFAEQNSISIRAGDARKVDPLVINFDAPAAALTEERFSFDLDADGSEENIAFIKPGSGFLALDLNNDGRINDGKELFGPQSGDGFSELSQYDQDGNGWIDENDAVYDNLRIWTKDPEGNDVLFALGQKGVGAIYLGNISSPFSITDQANQELGVVKSSGIFLRENGLAGSIQQVDLVV